MFQLPAFSNFLSPGVVNIFLLDSSFMSCHIILFWPCAFSALVLFLNILLIKTKVVADQVQFIHQNIKNQQPVGLRSV